MSPSGKKPLRTSPDDRIAPKKKKKKQSATYQPSFSLWKFFGKWLFIFGMWGAICLAVIILYYAHDLPDISHLGEVKRTPSITILAESPENPENKILLAQFGDSYGHYLQARQLPKHLINAILATEDRRFYDHFGIDPIGLLRAAYSNYRAGHIVQGGSTLTQQLAKNIFLSSERTLKRKVQEMLLALWLEHTYSKDQLLTLYVNRVYLGAGNYGVDAAARFYFGKSATQLTLHESAVIAGLLKAPSRYSPTNSQKLARERANQVLVNMEDAGFITKKDVVDIRYIAMASNPIGRGILKNPYFADWVMDELSDYMGGIDRNLTVLTTLNPQLQMMAEHALNNRMATEGDARNATQAAVVALSPDGRILAMAGGRNYAASQFNRAVKAHRQPGSAFKLFVYLAALENGMTPDQPVIDEPIATRDGWAPDNYNANYIGLTSLREAFAKSLNSVAVKTAQNICVSKIITLARRLGVSSPLNKDLGIALGTSEVTLLELTQAYAHLANNGRSVWSYGIKEVRDGNGTLIYERQATTSNQVIQPHTVTEMNVLLTSVIENGTGKRANIGRPAAGKTGTSQDYRDAWFVGFTPDIVTGVWVGNDNNTPMKGVTGGAIPAGIWHDFMLEAHQNQPVRDILVENTPLRETPEEKSDNSVWDSILKSFGN